MMIKIHKEDPFFFIKYFYCEPFNIMNLLNPLKIKKKISQPKYLIINKLTYIESHIIVSKFTIIKNSL